MRPDILNATWLTGATITVSLDPKHSDYNPQSFWLNALSHAPAAS